MSCGAVRGWLHRDAEALDEAERLVLEEHLQRCGRCRDDRAQLDRVRRLGHDVPRASIGPRGHTRAIARALLAHREAAPVTSHRPHRPRLARWSFAIAGAVAAAAVALVAWPADDGASRAEIASRPTTAAPRLPPVASTATRDPAPSQAATAAAPATSPTPARPAPRMQAPDVAVVDGSLASGDRTITAGEAVPGDAPLRTAERARIVMHGTTVTIAASSELRVAPIERTILLARGELDLDGDAAIDATRFRVEVRGAARVTERTVTVRRGTARVLVDGKLVKRLAAGTTWTRAEDHDRAVLTARGPLAGSADAAPPTAEYLLGRARTAFAARDYDAAARAAEAALGASPSRTQAAEATTVLAECAHVTGQIDEAIARYEAIATRFADLPAGETALFAAVRLAASRGDTATTRALAERYLDRYPSGRFADDTRRISTERRTP